MEMYNQFQEIMELEKNIKDLDDELEELFNYVKLEEAEKQGVEAAKISDEAHKLTLVASIFLPATFLATVFALFSGDLRLTTSWDWRRIWAIVIVLILVIVAFYFHRKINDWLNRIFYKKEEKNN